MKQNERKKESAKPLRRKRVIDTGKYDDFDVGEFIRKRKKMEDFVEYLMRKDGRNKGKRWCLQNTWRILSNGKLRLTPEQIEILMVMPNPDTICRSMRRVKRLYPELKQKDQDERKFDKRLFHILTEYYSDENKQMKLDVGETDG